MNTNFTFINDLPIICNEKIYIDEKYNLHLNQQLYAEITPYIIELTNININLMLKLNNIYILRLKNIYIMDLSINNISNTNLQNIYINVKTRLISYSNLICKFTIIEFL